jgi:hypothetical protein
MADMSDPKTVLPIPYTRSDAFVHLVRGSLALA